MGLHYCEEMKFPFLLEHVDYGFTVSTLAFVIAASSILPLPFQKNNYRRLMVIWQCFKLLVGVCWLRLHGFHMSTPGREIIGAPRIFGWKNLFVDTSCFGYVSWVVLEYFDLGFMISIWALEVGESLICGSWIPPKNHPHVRWFCLVSWVFLKFVEVLFVEYGSPRSYKFIRGCGVIDLIG